MDTQAMYKGLTASVLSTGRPSQYSEHLLVRLGLAGRFDEEPGAVLAGLRGPGRGLSREYLFVLSELSFFYAARNQKILYEHLGIPCGLECEVVDRVGAAAAAMEKPEPPEVETEGAERP